MTARIFRRAARPPAGFTWRRIARRLPVSAPRLTSAHTGRPSNFTAFVMRIVTLRVPDIDTEKNCLPSSCAPLVTRPRPRFLLQFPPINRTCAESHLYIAIGMPGGYGGAQISMNWQVLEEARISARTDSVDVYANRLTRSRTASDATQPWEADDT